MSAAKGQAGAKAAEPAEGIDYKAKRKAHHIACVEGERAAIAAGFVHAKGPGYWTAVNVFCHANGIPYPSKAPGEPKAKAPGVPKVAPAPKAPSAAEVAAAKREARLAQKRAAEKVRRARIKAGSAR